MCQSHDAYIYIVIGGQLDVKYDIHRIQLWLSALQYRKFKMLIVVDQMLSSILRSGIVDI